jgi:hypothetical protein
VDTGDAQQFCASSLGGVVENVEQFLSEDRGFATSNSPSNLPTTHSQNRHQLRTAPGSVENRGGQIMNSTVFVNVLVAVAQLLSSKPDL